MCRKHGALVLFGNEQKATKLQQFVFEMILKIGTCQTENHFLADQPNDMKKN